MSPQLSSAQLKVQRSSQVLKINKKLKKNLKKSPSCSRWLITTVWSQSWKTIEVFYKHKSIWTTYEPQRSCCEKNTPRFFLFFFFFQKLQKMCLLKRVKAQNCVTLPCLPSRRFASDRTDGPSSQVTDGREKKVQNAQKLRSHRKTKQKKLKPVGKGKKNRRWSHAHRRLAERACAHPAVSQLCADKFEELMHSRGWEWPNCVSLPLCSSGTFPHPRSSQLSLPPPLQKKNCFPCLHHVLAIQ